MAGNMRETLTRMFGDKPLPIIEACGWEWGFTTHINHAKWDDPCFQSRREKLEYAQAYMEWYYSLSAEDKEALNQLRREEMEQLVDKRNKILIPKAVMQGLTDDEAHEYLVSTCTLNTFYNFIERWRDGFPQARFWLPHFFAIREYLRLERKIVLSAIFFWSAETKAYFGADSRETESLYTLLLDRAHPYYRDNLEDTLRFWETERKEYARPA